MRLLEYEGKELLKELGIKIPHGAVATTSKEAELIRSKIGTSVVLKAQIPTGGRGKAGGIIPVDNKSDIKRATSCLLGKMIKGYQVDKVLIEEKLPISQELYLGFIVDTAAGKIKFIFSKYGGVNIEEIAENKPSALHSEEINSLRGFTEYEARNLIKESGFHGSLLVKLAKIAITLYRCFKTQEMVMAEINPLVINKDGNPVAADVLMEIDDNALFRSKTFDKDALRERIIDELEREAYDLGVNSFVKLEGEIGIVASGAGLGMTTMDILQRTGFQAANFLETGGRITKKLVQGSINIVRRHKNVKGIIVNLYGGINPMVDAAKGVVNAVGDGKERIPIVIKLLGNKQEEAWKILEAADLTVVKSVHTERAVKKLKEMLR